jgi:DNA-directed RNA polymerase II subunit RPB2
VGESYRPELLCKYVRVLRRNGLVAADVSVSWDVFGYEINIMTDGGRTCRPLIHASAIFDVNNMKYSGTTWSRMLAGTLLPDDKLIPEFFSKSAIVDRVEELGGATSLGDVSDTITRHETSGTSAPIELIDTEELSYTLVGNKYQVTGVPDRNVYTHFEIHPALMFSPLTASLPMFDHNHSPYNSFGMAQTKQGLGIYCTSFNERADVSGFVLHTPELPLVTTYFAEKLCKGAFMHGHNVIVAICSYTGYNQEDAVILNRSSIARGLFDVSHYATLTYKEEVSYDGDFKVLFGNPTAVEGLDTNGMPTTGQVIHEGSPLLSMYAENATDGTTSNIVKRADKTTWGTVDKVFVTPGSVGHRACKIRLREVRTPTLGDKVASRFGQKGVVGIVLDEEDMPFTFGGLRPDVILNPNCIPKRMTVAHLLEALLGRMACDSGQRIDATSFDGVDHMNTAVKYFASRPPREDWSSTGDVVMYNGRTGEQMAMNVYTGVNYYNRLKHMSVDKIHYRSADGPRSTMTHQPTQGRGNNGGLKMGEMEQHCMLSHGVSSFLKESFNERSDKFSVNVDERTGNRAEKGTQLPGGVSGIVEVGTSYSFKQMSQELESMCISMRMAV